MPKDDGKWRTTGNGRWYHENWYGIVHLKAICAKCEERCFARQFRSQDTGKPIFCSRSCKQSYYSSRQDLSHLKKFEFKKGQPAHNFKGGYLGSGGYVVDYGEDRKLMLQHRLVLERLLKRKLRRSEVIHHIDGDKTNNRIENLEIMTQSEHTKLHWQEGAFADRVAGKIRRKLKNGKYHSRV